MTGFGKSSLSWLIVGSVVIGLAGVVGFIAQEKTKEIRLVQQHVEKSQLDLANLQKRFVDWQRNTPHGKAASIGTLRIEPVAVNVDFPASSFNKLGTILGQMYTDEGVLNLREFSLTVGPGGIMHVSLSGQKTFLQE